MKKSLTLTLILTLIASTSIAVLIQPIQLRRDSGDNWHKYNPVLAQGEEGLKMAGSPSRAVGRKVGDGVTPWTSLPWFQNMSSAAQSTTIINTSGGAVALSVDATGDNQTQDIADYNNIIVCKADATANTVTITDSTPRTVPVDPLSVTGECAELILSNGTWYLQ